MKTPSEIAKEIKRTESLIKDYNKSVEKAENQFNRRNKYGKTLEEYRSVFEGLTPRDAELKSTNVSKELSGELGIDYMNDFESYYKVSQFVDAAKEYWQHKDFAKHAEAKLAELREQLSPFKKQEESREAVAKNIKDVLEEMMADFKVQWFDKMETWHRELYDYIKSKTPKARDWYYRYKRFYYDNGGYRFFRTHKRLEARFELKNRQMAEIISNDANRYDDIESYITKVKKDLELDWRIDMNTLANKCTKFNLDLTQVTVSNPSVTPKGFEAVIKDGKPRLIYVRMIWAAQQSKLVKPHTRYIITERKTNG